MASLWAMNVGDRPRDRILLVKGCFPSICHFRQLTRRQRWWIIDGWTNAMGIHQYVRNQSFEFKKLCYWVDGNGPYTIDSSGSETALESPIVRIFTGIVFHLLPSINLQKLMWDFIINVNDYRSITNVPSTFLDPPRLYIKRVNLIKLTCWL